MKTATDFHNLPPQMRARINKRLATAGKSVTTQRELAQLNDCLAHRAVDSGAASKVSWPEADAAIRDFVAEQPERETTPTDIPALRSNPGSFQSVHDSIRIDFSTGLAELGTETGVGRDANAAADQVVVSQIEGTPYRRAVWLTPYSPTMPAKESLSSPNLHEVILEGDRAVASRSRHMMLIDCSAFSNHDLLEFATRHGPFNAERMKRGIYQYGELQFDYNEGGKLGQIVHDAVSHAPGFCAHDSSKPNYRRISAAEITKSDDGLTTVLECRSPFEDDSFGRGALAMVAFRTALNEGNRDPVEAARETSDITYNNRPSLVVNHDTARTECGAAPFLTISRRTTIAEGTVRGRTQFYYDGVSESDGRAQIRVVAERPGAAPREATLTAQLRPAVGGGSYLAITEASFIDSAGAVTHLQADTAKELRELLRSLDVPTRLGPRASGEPQRWLHYAPHEAFAPYFALEDTLASTVLESAVRDGGKVADVSLPLAR